MVALRGVFSSMADDSSSTGLLFSFAIEILIDKSPYDVSSPFSVSKWAISHFTQILCAYIGSRWQVSNLRWRQKKCSCWEGYIGHWSRYWALSEYRAAHTRFQILLCVNFGLFVPVCSSRDHILAIFHFCDSMNLVDQAPQPENGLVITKTKRETLMWYNSSYRFNYTREQLRSTQLI